MKPIPSPWLAGTCSAGLRAALVLTGMLITATSAFAAAPPANTVIGNQASAAYIDPNGNAQTTTSNLVQTTVQQVGAFTLDSVNQTTTTVVNTKTGAAGAVVYAPHVITNTGNGADGFAISVSTASGPFSNVAVYADPTFSGQPGSTTPLCSVSSGSCVVPAQTIAGSNGQFALVVAYTIPSIAPAATPYGTGTVTVTPSTGALYTSPNTTAADVDNVNTATGAVFNLTASVSQPSSGITAPGGGAWPSAAVAGQRSTSGTCSTTWTPGLTSGSGCTYTVYTLTYSNTGSATGKFNLRDVLPSGLTYVAGSAVWSDSPGVAMGDGAGGDPAGVDFQVVSGGLNFVDNSLPANATRSISFVVLVNNTAALGTGSTTNSPTYDSVDATGATAASPVSVTSATTNNAAFTVTAMYGLALGSLGSTQFSAPDTTALTPNNNGSDTTTVPSTTVGGTVAFTQILYNTGNATDTATITSASPGTGGGAAFPAGTTFSYYKADGATPLTSSSGSWVTDPILAGGSINVVVKATLPNTVSPAVGPLNYTLTVSATSVGDGTKIDTTRDVLNAVVGALVDLTNSAAGTSSGAGADTGPGPSASPTLTNSVVAGSTTAFPLFVANNDTITNTYSLNASATASFPGTLPVGWVVKFVAGNVTAANCASAAAITSVAVSNGQQSQVTACVTPPASQAAVTAQPVYFQVKSTSAASTGSTVVDTLYDAVTVTSPSTYAATLTPSGTSQVAAGSSVAYAHTLANTGTNACAGPYTVAATLPAADVTAGWTTAIYLDVNGDGILDAGDTLVTGAIAGPLAVGAQQKFLVKVFAPGGATAGATDTATVMVTFPSGATSCGTPSVADITTVVSGQIRVVTTQALDTACNGTVGTQSAALISNAKSQSCIVYQVTATNPGTAQVTNLSVTSAIPSYTTLNGTQPTTKCTSTGVTPALTNTNFTSPGSAVSCGGQNSVQPGGSVTMTFEVKIN